MDLVLKMKMKPEFWMREKLCSGQDDVGMDLRAELGRCFRRR